MQNKDEKTLQLRKILGDYISEYRTHNTSLSCNKMEEEYDFSRGSLNRIENGNVDCKFITLWKIAEALGMKPSEFVKQLEDKLGKDFKLIDE
jgi:transcriptional regulator with XRE-family HTH domain